MSVYLTSSTHLNKLKARLFLNEGGSMDKSSMVTRILLMIAAILLICIGSFSMTRAIPSLYIACFYLVSGIIILGWAVYNFVMYQKQNKKDTKKVPEQ